MTMLVIDEYDEDGTQNPDFLRIRSQMEFLCGGQDDPWVMLGKSKHVPIALHFRKGNGLIMYAVRTLPDWISYRSIQVPPRWAWFSVDPVFLP